MEFIELKDIERKDSPIHYINEYHGMLIYKIDGKINEDLIEIILEKTALGTTNIQLSLPDKRLKNHIEELEIFINEKNKSGLFN